METTLFYVFGIALTVFALIVSAVGLRSDRFPTKALSLLTTLVFAVLIVGTATFAVLTSREEKAHREAELAAERLEEGEADEVAEAPEQEEGGTEAPEEGEASEEGEDPAGGAPPAGSGPVMIAADPEQLAFETDRLSAPAGDATFLFDNPAQIPHDFVIEDDGGRIDGTPQIAQDSAELTVSLEAGEYIFYCSVLGHREAGMEGSLTVE